MKKILILMLLFASQLVFAQVDQGAAPSADAFRNFLRKMEKLTCFSYQAMCGQKSIFEKDTVFATALVTIIKNQDSITFLHVINHAVAEEMLIYEDTAWYRPPGKKEWNMTGHGQGKFINNPMLNFVYLNSIRIENAGGDTEPFWRLSGENGALKTYSFMIEDLPPEITEIAVEITINEEDSLLYSMSQDAWFGLYKDNQYQEIRIWNYDYYDPEDIALPATYRILPRMVKKPESASIPPDEIKNTAEEEVILDTLELETTDGQIINLPESGLIFFDLWYAGCFPCMKSSPVIEKIYGQYHDRVHFYGVNEIDLDTAKIARFKEKMSISFPVLMNKKEKLALLVTGHKSYPTFILMDAATKRVLWHSSGYTEELEEIITGVLEEHL